MPRTLPTTNAGFTLVELLVVLAALALVVGVAVPAYRIFASGSQLTAAAQQLTADLKTARRLAYANNRTLAVTFDAASSSYVFAGVARTLPVQMAIKDTDAHSVYFYADGTADPARFVLQDRGRETHMQINWLTGQLARDASQNQ